jgi:hypothetical protein
MTNSSYVYAVKVDGHVKYIGKGTGRRVDRHLTAAARIACKERKPYGRFENVQKRLAAAILQGAKIECVVLHSKLSSQRALELECIEIAKHRMDDLWNLTHGGEGIDSETASALAKKRWLNPAARKQHSVVLKKSWSDEKLRADHQARMSAIHNRPDRKQKQKELAQLRWTRPGEREKQSIAARQMQLDRAAKKHATTFCAALSFEI